MRIARLAAWLIVGLLAISLYAEIPSRKLTVTGKLTRVMAIGGESTGWALELEPEATVDGKQVSSIEVESRDTKQLEALESKRVEVTGTIHHRHGVETGKRSVLSVSSIKEVEDATQAPSETASFSLPGSEWLLEDLGGSGVIDNIQATLVFPEAGKIAGFGSCNRFFGPVEIHGDAMKIGPLGSTRMACPEAVMSQETKYLAALQAAERFEWTEPYLLIHCKGPENPLRFTRMPAKPAAP